MKAAETLGEQIGLVKSCKALAVCRATLYRHRAQEEGGREQTKPRRKPPHALTHEQHQEILSVMNSERFVDKAPREIYASLLDEGVYLCSVRTMYRILANEAQLRERRDQLRHPRYTKPELLATGPNEVWSWDITKLKGPEKWTYYYLYVIMDIFSRYVVGWMVARQESARLAERLIAESCAKERIEPGQLTIHADRGSSMRSKVVAQLLSDLGVTKTHSRPHVSNDNPFSESQFKTLKYRPQFPKRFGSLEDARAWSREFFRWYNQEHYHSGIALLTPAQVHEGKASAVIERRKEVLQAAYEAYPERFRNKVPQPPRLREEVWINPPKGGQLGDSKERSWEGRRKVLDDVEVDERKITSVGERVAR